MIGIYCSRNLHLKFNNNFTPKYYKRSSSSSPRRTESQLKPNLTSYTYVSVSQFQSGDGVVVKLTEGRSRHLEILVRMVIGRLVRRPVLFALNLATLEYLGGHDDD